MFRASNRLTFQLLLLCTGSLRAQENRITSIDPAQAVALKGNLRPARLLRNDGGRADGDASLSAMTLFLKLSSRQQADLRQLLDDQQSPASPLYHRWLTPEQFAERFGLSQGDIAATTGWLRAQGFTVGK